MSYQYGVKVDPEYDYAGYRCYLVGVNGRIEQREELTARDEQTAAAEARAVLEASSYRAAELWFLGRKLADLSKWFT